MCYLWAIFDIVCSIVLRVRPSMYMPTYELVQIHERAWISPNHSSQSSCPRSGWIIEQNGEQARDMGINYSYPKLINYNDLVEGWESPWSWISSILQQSRHSHGKLDPHSIAQKMTQNKQLIWLMTRKERFRRAWCNIFTGSDIQLHAL